MSGHLFGGILEMLGKVFEKFARSKESQARLDEIQKKATEAMRRRKELGQRPLNDGLRKRLNAIMEIDVDEDERLRLLAKFDEETRGRG